MRRYRCYAKRNPEGPLRPVVLAFGFKWHWGDMITYKAKVDHEVLTPNEVVAASRLFDTIPYAEFCAFASSQGRML